MNENKTFQNKFSLFSVKEEMQAKKPEDDELTNPTKAKPGA